MSPEPKPGVIGSLPRTRPHRRSDKRPAPPGGAPPVDSQAEQSGVAKAAPSPKTKAAAKRAGARTRAGKPTRAAAAAKPAAARTRAGKPTPAAAPKPRAAQPAPPPRPETPAPPPPSEPAPGMLGTAAQAAAELAEIGLHAGVRALRRAVSCLPRP
jgi:hypothetical protein